MIIAVDGNEANVANRVGISEYAYELLRFFHTQQSKGKTFHIYLKSSPNDAMPQEGPFWQYKVIRPGKLWTQFALPIKLFLTRSKPVVFFSPTHYAPRFSPIPTVIAIMDMSFLKFPELFKEKDLYQLKNWTSYSAKKAKTIFTISDASKSDIIAEYGVSDGSVVVTYPGIKPAVQLTPHVFPMQELKTKFALSDSYILFVGTLQPRKNIVRLIEAFAIVKKKDSLEKLQLVIVGKKGWLYDEILAAPEKHGVLDSVKFLDFVADDDLSQLYQNALFFVLPSLYEGFGLPVLEAMKYGCPVITSNTSSLPEAGGDAALYVNPEDSHDIAKKMIELIENKEKREIMRKKGLEHVKKFSWDKTAAETLSVLTKLGNKS